MSKVSFLFSVIFALVLGWFSLTSCTSPNFLWCTSSGIVTYNRHTGQFEMLWENQAERREVIHDTIYVIRNIEDISNHN